MVYKRSLLQSLRYTTKNVVSVIQKHVTTLNIKLCASSKNTSSGCGAVGSALPWGGRVASKNLLNDGFYAAKSTKQGENGKNLRLFVVFDYAT